MTAAHTFHLQLPPVQCSYSLLRDALPAAAPWTHHARWVTLYLDAPLVALKLSQTSPCSGKGSLDKEKGVCSFLLILPKLAEDG